MNFVLVDAMIHDSMWHSHYVHVVDPMRRDAVHRRSGRELRERRLGRSRRGRLLRLRHLGRQLVVVGERRRRRIVVEQRRRWIRAARRAAADRAARRAAADRRARRAADCRAARARRADRAAAAARRAAARAAASMDVTVVGAGVIGLTTALDARGARPPRARRRRGTPATHTTSAVAGAVWFPVSRRPARQGRGVGRAHARRWLERARRSRRRAPASTSSTGYEITPDRHRAAVVDRRAAMVGRAARSVDVERAPAPVTGAPLAWQFAAPRAEPALFLPWLAASCARPIERRAVADLARRARRRRRSTAPASPRASSRTTTCSSRCSARS